MERTDGSYIVQQEISKETKGVYLQVSGATSATAWSWNMTINRLPGWKIWCTKRRINLEKQEESQSGEKWGGHSET